MELLRRTIQLGAGLALLVAVGCVQTGEIHSSSSRAPANATIGSPSGTQVMTVEIISNPSDGMVVVNRQPVGLTPRAVEVPVTTQGYMADPVTIAVRFVARDVEEASMTSSITLYPTDRVPLRLEFKREEVKRVLR